MSDVRAAVAAVVDPEIRVVTTSREPLGIAGEQTYLLPPLGTPPPGTGYRAVDIAPFEAVTLLVERAHNTVSDFELTDANADAIAQLCRSLDGIPLAVELAASRLRSLSPSQLVERIDRRFALLTGGNRSALPRQQTLRALIDWSYDLCSEDERLLWARLSVFPGSFDLEAADAGERDEVTPVVGLGKCGDAADGADLGQIRRRFVFVADGRLNDADQA